MTHYMHCEKYLAALAFRVVFLQDPPFRHTGMVQHDLDGNLQFLHRTYLGKFDPSRSEPWREMDFVSSPLTPEQAVVYSEAYGFFPHQVSTDFEKYCCPDGSRTTDASQCSFKECKSPGKEILTVAVGNLEPEVRTVTDSLNELFAGIQANYGAKSA